MFVCVEAKANLKAKLNSLVGLIMFSSQTDSMLQWVHIFQCLYMDLHFFALAIYPHCVTNCCGSIINVLQILSVSKFFKKKNNPKC